MGKPQQDQELKVGGILPPSERARLRAQRVWVIYPDGSLYPAVIKQSLLWGRVEVVPQAPAPDAGQSRIVTNSEVVPR